MNTTSKDIKERLKRTSLKTEEWDIDSILPTATAMTITAAWEEQQATFSELIDDIANSDINNISVSYYQTTGDIILQPLTITTDNANETIEVDVIISEQTKEIPFSRDNLFFINIQDKSYDQFPLRLCGVHRYNPEIFNLTFDRNIFIDE